MLWPSPQFKRKLVIEHGSGGVRKTVRFIIYGSGAIGSCVGGLLAERGCQTVLVGRSAHSQAINADGLVIKSKDGNLKVRVNAIDSLNELEPGENDVIFLAVKSPHTAQSLDDLSAHFSGNYPIFCFQNGVINESLAAQVFENVYGVYVAFSANFLRPGVIERTMGNLLVVGKFPAGIDDLTAQVVGQLAQAGFKASEHTDVMSLKYYKLLLNLSNPLLAIIDSWVQKTNTDKSERQFLADCIEEGAAVLDRVGIKYQGPPGYPTIREYLDRLRSGELADENAYDLPPERRTYPSTWQDLALKRGSTESEYFTGEIVRLGKQVNIPTAYNSVLLRIVDEMAEERIPPGAYTVEDLREMVRAEAALEKRDRSIKPAI